MPAYKALLSDASNPIPSVELVDVVTVACITLLCSGFFGGHWNAPSALPIRPVVVFVVRSQNLPVMFGQTSQARLALFSITGGLVLKTQTELSQATTLCKELALLITERQPLTQEPHSMRAHLMLCIQGLRCNQRRFKP